MDHRTISKLVLALGIQAITATGILSPAFKGAIAVKTLPPLLCLLTLYAATHYIIRHVAALHAPKQDKETLTLLRDINLQLENIDHHLRTIRPDSEGTSPPRHPERSEGSESPLINQPPVFLSGATKRAPIDPPLRAQFFALLKRTEYAAAPAVIRLEAHVPGLEG